MFLAYVSPLGRALVDKRLVSARELDLGAGPLCGGGCTRTPAELPFEDGVGPRDAGRGDKGIFLRRPLPGRPLGRGWGERSYDIQRWNQMPRIGYFAAL